MGTVNSIEQYRRRASTINAESSSNTTSSSSNTKALDLISSSNKKARRDRDETEILGLTHSSHEIERIRTKHNLKILKSIKIGSNTLSVSSGSVVEAHADALVNAANNQGLGGGGIDGAFNRAGGKEFENLRKALPLNEKGFRINTGDCVYTQAAGDIHSKYVIHAVGPDYDMLGHSSGDKLLTSAYENIIRLGNELKIQTLASCLLSSGIYAGDRGLKSILKIAVSSLVEALKSYPSSNMHVFLVGFTKSEQDTLVSVSEEYLSDYFEQCE